MSLLSLVSCGGGGKGVSIGIAPQPTADYSLSLNPSSLVVSNGGPSQSSTLSVTPANGFSATVAVSVTGVPAGVTVSPATFTVAAGSSQTITFSSSGSAQNSPSTITFQGTSGTLSHSANLSLQVASPVTAAHAPIRARYLRTDSAYDANALSTAPPSFTAYDAAHRRFFVSNPFLNEVDVFDAAQEVQIGSVSIPEAWGLGISPIDGSLYAGTLLGDVYQIDTNTLTVLKRYPFSGIGPGGYGVSEVFVLADGRLALLGGLGGIIGVDGASSAAVWNPATNELDTGVCPSITHIGAFAVSGDRQHVLVASIDEPFQVCSYDPVAQQSAVGDGGQFGSTTFVREIIPSPDGSRFFLTTNLLGVLVFDSKTAAVLGQIAPTNVTSLTELPSAAAGAVLSLDGKTLYLVDQLTGEVQAYDTSSLKQTGWIPSFTLDDSQTTTIVLSAIDETGLIAGPTGHGVAFLDGSSISSSKPTAINPGFALPPAGPLTGDTSVSGFGSAIGNSAALTEIYVGNSAGTSPSPSSANSLSVTTPPSARPGAVDLTELFSDGGLGIQPEAFSYGPTILEVVPNGATADGGQTGALIGYGFGNSSSAVSVTINNNPATVQSVIQGAPIEPYPFPAGTILFTIPPGTAGSVVDVTVSTPSGSATAASAFHYTAAQEFYPLTASLQSGIYDAHRDLYYFADQSQIQVLSRSSGHWLSPIPLPLTTAQTRLWSIAESPDGTQMAVADYGGEAVYLLNPDNPSSAVQFAVPTFYGTPRSPVGVVVLNNGNIYYVAVDRGGTGTPGFIKFVPSTGVSTQLGGTFTTITGIDLNSHLLLSPDGNRVYLEDGGQTLWLDTSNDQINYSIGTENNAGGTPDLAVSGDGSTVDIDGYLADTFLNPETVPAYIEWETWLPTAVHSQKLNTDGSLLFIPLTDGIDIMARNTGRLLYRIQIPVTAANVYDALVNAPQTNTLAVITSDGIAFIDLSSLPVPSDDMTAFPAIVGSAYVPFAADRSSSALRPRIKVRRIRRPELRSAEPQRYLTAPKPNARPTGKELRAEPNWQR